MKNFYKIPVAASLLVTLLSAPTFGDFYVFKEGKTTPVVLTQDNLADYQEYKVYEYTGPIETYKYKNTETPVDFSEGFLTDPKYLGSKTHYIFYKAE